MYKLFLIFIYDIDIVLNWYSLLVLKYRVLFMCVCAMGILNDVYVYYINLIYNVAYFYEFSPLCQATITGEMYTWINYPQKWGSFNSFNYMATFVRYRLKPSELWNDAQTVEGFLFNCFILRIRTILWWFVCDVCL